MSESAMSSDEEHPRFRIPRGSSDEEIDSDLASGPGSPAANSDGEEQVILQKPTRGPNPSRETIKKNASALIVGMNPLNSTDSDEQPEFDDDDDSDEDCDDEEALANVTATVTTRDLSIKDARHVDPCSVDVPSITIGASSSAAPSHPAMLDRILQTIRSSAATDKTQPIKELPKLQKKIDRLHTDRATNLSVPLPAPVSERLERRVAYEQTSKLLTDKWTDTVIRNRRAERLTFPINEPSAPERSTKDLVSRKKNLVVDHEQEIADILKAAGVEKDADVTEAEKNAVEDALAAGKLSKEDIIRRQRELARVRSMVFHFDQKMKRIKKIKSKKFRKEMKKDRERLSGEKDATLDSEAEMEEAIAAERRRVEERVTQRHKNTSKWVRRQLQRGDAKRDDSTRAAIEDQLRIHEELKRRQNREIGSGGDDSDDDYNGSGSDEDSAAADEVIANLEKELNNPSSASQKKKGIMSLRFMQAAEERKRKQALELLNEMKEDSDEDEEERVVARQSFSGSRKPNYSNSQTAAKKYMQAEDKEGAGNDSRLNSHYDDSLLENDNDHEAETFEKRVREQYVSADEVDAHPDEEERCIDHETAAEVIRDAAKSSSGFTTQLNDRLTADDDNPWLNGFSVEAVTPVKEQPDKKELPKKETVKDRRDIEINESTKSNDHNSSLKTKTKADKTVSDSAVEQSKANSTQRNRKRKRKEDSEANTQESSGNASVAISIDQLKNASKSTGVEEGTGEVKTKRDRKRKKRQPDIRKANSDTKRTESGKSRENQANDNPKNGTDVEPASTSAGGQLESSLNVGEGICSQNIPPKELQDADQAADLSRMEDIALAFAGVGGADLAEFEQAKSIEVEESLPTPKSLNADILPGWGAWDGAGMSEKQKRRRKDSPFVKAALEKFEQARATAIKSRSDRNMRNVILDQKQYESATKMTLASVPYPYQSREEWERELSRPLCRELASNTAMGQSIKRKVDVRPGTILEPIRNPAPSRTRNAPTELVKRSGKEGVINLRKAKAKHRADARRGLMS